MNLLTTELREYIAQRDCLLSIAELHCTTTSAYSYYMTQVDVVEDIIRKLSIKQLNVELKIQDEMDKLENNGQRGLDL